MKKFTKAIFLINFLVLGACSTIEQIPIDYLVPAEVSFPAEIRRVGIVNNVSEYGRTHLLESDTTLKVNEIARKVTYHFGNAPIATASLAEAIAAENYFDLVAINDSSLRAGDIHIRENTLSKTEVQELTEEMDVDMIIALENLLIQTTRVIQFLPDIKMFWGTVDAKVFPNISLYTPHRNAPLVNTILQDSIFWEDLRYSESPLRAQGVISDEDMLKEASYFAGTIPVKYILPHWTSDIRYYYGGGSVEMRDAVVYVKENSWDAAYELWKKVYDTGKGKKKMRAAFNIALYYEMKDDLENAYLWAETAFDLAKTIEKVSETSGSGKGSNYAFIAHYLMKLAPRKENSSKLMIQMERF